MTIQDVAAGRKSVSTPGTAPVPIGSLPSLGSVPARMHAQVVRRDRYGDPASAFRPELVPTPHIGRGEVLVAVMSAGINYNNVWAARGYPVDQIALRQKKGEPEDFHVGGSDASGIVYAIGEAVSGIEVGDEVIIHPGWWDPSDPWITGGRHPMIAPGARILGYDTNYGSVVQFPPLQAHQAL